ncbi:MAG TPA: MarR family transcriptional regulator [Gaiellaceae bacterium]
MAKRDPSSPFTNSPPSAKPFGPPLIGALLRIPWEAVQHHMLERLHEHGFDDLDAAHLNVFQYPGPQGARPSELAARLRISKQALNYLLGELERLDYLERRPDPDDLRSKRVALTPRGTSAIHVIREAVSELEDAWAGQLGRKRFEDLRGLLVELNESAHGAAARPGGSGA